MSDALIKGLRERLGISADAELDENGLLAAVDEALEEQEAGPTNGAAPGTVVLDEGQHRQLLADAAAGRDARQRQLADDRSALVDKAVADGRIAPARREHWLAALEADPGSATTLEGLAKGLVPVTANGFTGGVDEASDEDLTYNKLFPTPKES